MNRSKRQHKAKAANNDVGSSDSGETGINSKASAAGGGDGAGWIKSEIREAGVNLARENFLEVIEKASLMHAMLSFVQASIDELVAAGADEMELKSMRMQDFKTKVFPTLPMGPLSVIVKWLAENSRPALDAFSKEQGKDAHGKLFEYLLPMMMEIDGVGNDVPGTQERARCFLAAMEDKGYKDVAAAVSQLVSVGDRGPVDAMYQAMRKVAEATASDNGEAQENDEVEPHMRLYMECAFAIKSKDRERARTLLREVGRYDNAKPEHLRVHSRLRDYYQRTMPEIQVSARQVDPLEGVDLGGLDSLDVLALCNKSSPNNANPGHSYAFSKPLAVRIGGEGEWLELTDHQRETIFPKSGSIIHLEGKQFPQLPKYMSYSVWRVEEQNLSADQTEKFNTRVRAARKVCPAHLVLELEHIASHERNLARQWLRHASFFDVEAEGERVLRFEDGLFVHTTSSYENLIEDNFTHALRSWEALPMIELQNGARLHVGNLPESTGEYHLTPPIGALSRKLRNDQQCTASEQDLFTRTLGRLGENHALAARLSGLDAGSVKVDEGSLERLVKLYEKTDRFKDEIKHLMKDKNADATMRLEEAERRYMAAVAEQESIDGVFEKRDNIIKKMEDQAEKKLKDMREHMKDGTDDTLHTQMLVAGIQERLDGMERSIAKLLEK